MVVILEGNGLITRGEEGRKVRGPCMQPCHAMPWSHHAFRRCLCTLHYLTSSSSSSGNVRRENWNGLRDCGGGGVDAERRGANFGTKLGRQTTVCSLARRPRPFYVEMWLVMFPNENGDWGGTSNGEREEGRREHRFYREMEHESDHHNEPHRRHESQVRDTDSTY